VFYVPPTQNRLYERRTVTQKNTASPLVYNNMGWLWDSSHRGQVHLGLNGGGTVWIWHESFQQ